LRIIVKESKLVVIHFNSLGTEEFLKWHCCKQGAKSFFKQNLLHEKELTIGLQFEGIFDGTIVLLAHKLHVLFAGHSIGHLCDDFFVGFFFVHVVDVEVAVNTVLKNLFLVAGISVIVLSG